MRRLALLCVVLAAGCKPTREGSARQALERAAATSVTSFDEAIRLGLCGWEPAASDLDAKDIVLVWKGDDASGTVEAGASFVDPKGRFRCEGRLALDYTFRETSGRTAQHYWFKNVRRIGPAPAFLAEVEAHAKPLAVGEYVKAFGEPAWRLPDGRFGAAFRVDVKTAGNYQFSYKKKYETYHAPNPVIYQGRAMVIEGNPGGALGFWSVTAGPTWVFLSDETGEAVDLTFEPATK